MQLVSVVYQQYMNSPAWRKKRVERLVIDGNECARCDATEKLQVHHLTYDRLGSERMEDLLTLCEECHAREHGKGFGSVPAAPESFYLGRWYERMHFEAQQEICSDALQTSATMEEFFSRMPIAQDDPRPQQIRDLFDALMDDIANFELRRVA